MAYDALNDPFKRQLYDDLMLKNEQGVQHEFSNSTSSHSEFDFETGFDSWEKRAQEKADRYAKMRYAQFKKRQLKGGDLFFYQVGLLFAMVCLFLIGGGLLYFAKNMFINVGQDKAAISGLIPGILFGVFGLFILYYVRHIFQALIASFQRS